MALAMPRPLPVPRSLPEFQRLFPDDATCIRYMEAVRWPDGFQCPACAEKGTPQRLASRPSVLRCRVCKHEASVTSGTVMHRTKVPLSVWFWAAYLLSSLTPGISSIQFQRQLGLTRHETAFQLLHKLRAAMVRPNVDRIGGKGIEVEMDEMLVGGETRGEGRGVHHMTYVIGAVEVRERPKLKKGQALTKAMQRRAGTYAGRLRLRVLPDRKAASLLGFARDTIAQGSSVVTDDYAGYARLGSECQVDHHAAREAGNREVAERFLPLIHLVFSNFKAWIAGCFHGVDPKHLQAYCNEFVFRFNRRHYPFSAFRSLLGLASVAPAPTYEGLYSGEWEHPIAAGPWELVGE